MLARKEIPQWWPFSFKGGRVGPSFFPTRDGLIMVLQRRKQLRAVDRGQVAIQQHILLGIKPKFSQWISCGISLLFAFFTGAICMLAWLLTGA